MNAWTSSVTVLLAATMLLTSGAGCAKPAPIGLTTLDCASQSALEELAASDISEVSGREFVIERADCLAHNRRVLN